MSVIEDRVRNLDERVKSLESKFNIAVTVAVFLGVSVAGLGTWVKTEAGNVSDLTKQINALEPIVATAKEQLTKTGNDQISLIQQKALPIVGDLTKQALDKMGTGSDEAYHIYARGVGDQVQLYSCPPGSFVSALGPLWANPGHSDSAVGDIGVYCRKAIP